MLLIQTEVLLILHTDADFFKKKGGIVLKIVTV